jgi:polyphenol oxidase
MNPAARAKMEPLEIDGLILLEVRLPGVFRAAFTTRHGGCSAGPFTSLNLDRRSDDDPASVERNRARLAQALSMIEGLRSCTGWSAVPGCEDLRPADRQTCQLVSPKQEHGLRVMGAAEYVAHAAGEPCDGLTIHPLLDRGLAATLLFADCVPVILSGDVDVAVAHGGWRGILGGVVQQAARAMTGPPGQAVIGPSIGPCCFSVSKEVADAFAARYGEGVVLRDSPRKLRVDLWGAVVMALGEVGVAPGQVINPRLCTCCNTDLFYSYRAEGPVIGRQGAVVWTATSSAATGERP